jgi:hypothetical protein
MAADALDIRYTAADALDMWLLTRLNTIYDC